MLTCQISLRGHRRPTKALPSPISLEQAVLTAECPRPYPQCFEAITDQPRWSRLAQPTSSEPYYRHYRRQRLTFSAAIPAHGVTRSAVQDRELHYLRQRPAC